MRFEWDSEKAAENLRKHRISFDEAATAFFDPLSMTRSGTLPRRAAIHHHGCLLGRSAHRHCAHRARFYSSNHQCKIGQRLRAQTL